MKESTMIPEDKSRERARSRAADQKTSKTEQVAVLLAGAAALLGFLLI